MSVERGIGSLTLFGDRYFKMNFVIGRLNSSMRCYIAHCNCSMLRDWKIILCCMIGRLFCVAWLGDCAVLSDFEIVLYCVIGRSLYVV